MCLLSLCVQMGLLSSVLDIYRLPARLTRLLNDSKAMKAASKKKKTTAASKGRLDPISAPAAEPIPEPDVTQAQMDSTDAIGANNGRCVVSAADGWGETSIANISRSIDTSRRVKPERCGRSFRYCHLHAIILHWHYTCHCHSLFSV